MLRQVMTGNVRGDEIEVLSGLSEGDKVALNGGAILASGKARHQTHTRSSDI